MKSLSKIQRTFTEILESSADIEIPAFLGNLQGVISADKKGSVYVVVQGVGIELIVKNNKVPQKYRWPVIIGKDKTDGTLRILRERNSFFEPEYIDIQDHSSTQQWPARDTLFVRPEQILPGLVVPTANSMTIDFVGFIYHYNGWHIVDNETIDLTSYIPSTEANWLLAQVDDTETISYVAGASVAGRELLLPSDIPAADIGNRPLFAIKMYAGQSQIVQTKTTTDIADLRWAGWLPIPATTAANDFQVGDGSGNWIKKTLAETITILRSSLDSIFAPIAKGVTNGDSHDHNGGDGGTIAYSSLSGTPTITNPPATTAANDFQVGNGSGSWIKKTLAETITILRSSLDSIYPAISAVVPINGWIPYAAVTPTRTVADDPTYTIQFAGVDLTAVLQEAMPVKWTQNSIVRYGWISSDPTLSSGNTVVTILTRCAAADTSANYDVLDTSTYPISNFYYGHPRQPGLGMPALKSTWSISVTDSPRYFTPTDSVWAVPTGSTANLTFPIGAWSGKYVTTPRDAVTGGTYTNAFSTLSTTTNTETDPTTTFRISSVGATAAEGTAIIMFTKKLTTKTVFRILFQAVSNGTHGSTCGFDGTSNIYAELAYL